MKTGKMIAILALGTILSITPVFAQSRGGGSRGSSSHSGRSVSSGSHSSSRSGGFSSSRGSSSHSSSRSGGFSSSRSNGSSSHSSNRVSTPSSNRNSSPSSGRVSSSSSNRNSSPRFSGNATPSTNRSGSTDYRRGSTPSGRGTDNGTNYRSSRSTIGTPTSSAPTRSGRSEGINNRRSSSVNGAPGDGRGPANNGPSHGYARPGHPGGVMPPSHRPMHPAPYFYHPYHHCMIHMHPIIWNPLPLRPLFWPGFWLYCSSYWYDYHVTDVTVVHRYVKDTYNMDMVSYAMSGDIMYAIVNDSDGNTYLQVYDKEDKLLAEQEISRKYIKTEIDRENGGCWIFKKNDKDPMLFLYTGGELLIYEAD